MAARFQSSLSLFWFILLITRHFPQQFYHESKDTEWILPGRSSESSVTEYPGLFCQFTLWHHIGASFTKVQSKFNIKYPVQKYSKRVVFLMDLTVHLDVQSNPGPEIQRLSLRPRAPNENLNDGTFEYFEMQYSPIDIGNRMANCYHAFPYVPGNADFRDIDLSDFNEIPVIYNTSLITLVIRLRNYTGYLFQRLVFKINLISFKVLNGLAPRYLQDLLYCYEPARRLRSSSDKWKFKIQSYNLKSYGLRAFSIMALKLWNDLPMEIRSISNINIFKSKLKTYPFKKAYNI